MQTTLYTVLENLLRDRGASPLLSSIVLVVVLVLVLDLRLSLPPEESRTRTRTIEPEPGRQPLPKA
jgi:hypothetical protein